MPKLHVDRTIVSATPNAEVAAISATDNGHVAQRFTHEGIRMTIVSTPAEAIAYAVGLLKMAAVVEAVNASRAEG